jgi:hypothetical protein
MALVGADVRGHGARHPGVHEPEQAAGDRDLDARSDVYGLGCVCYEMLAGRPPFTGPNAFAIISQHLTAVPPRLVAARGPLPEGITSAVARALAKAPAIASPAPAPWSPRWSARPPRRARPRRRRSAARRRATARRVAARARARVHQPRAGARSGLDLDRDRRDRGGGPGEGGRVRVIGQDAATRRRIAAAREERTIDAELAAEIGAPSGRSGWSGGRSRSSARASASRRTTSTRPTARTSAARRSTA